MYTLANIRPFGHNVGNTAISFAMRHMLYEVFGRLVTIIDYPATSRYESTARAGLTKSTVHEINRFADGVIVGGGNLYENNEIEVDPVALANLKAPLMLFSNSRGRVYGRNGSLEERTDVISDQKLKSLVRASDISASRDTATYNYIRGLGENDRIGFCPTINLNGYKSFLPPLPDSEIVGSLISIRTPSLMNLPISQQNLVQKHIETAIYALRESGHNRVRILCNDSRDLDFAVQFKGAFSVDPVYTNDVYQYLSLISNCSMLVSYRLHASLPAIAFNKPVVNITYDERAESLCSDLGVLDSSIKMMDCGGDAGPMIDTLIREGGYISADDSLRKGKWASIHEDQIEILEEFKGLVEAYVNLCRLA
ncbi:MAG: hypothetical protein CMD99_07220 [Gammaproteobacteria bacterium]|nr:hypothetical protein [Gammaproteobacteria bacterium]